MLGGEVVAAAEAVHHEVFAYGRDALDVTDAGAVLAACGEHMPQVVINCAAYTAVDRAEEEPEVAAAVNAAGAANVAEAAAAVGAKVVYVSTDYVFDGAKGAPYVETDATRPLSVYGKTKLEGEMATARATPRHMIVRTSWLFGAGGGNFVETMLGLSERLGEVLVVNDQVGSPTYARHLAEALIGLIEFEYHGVHHIAGGGQCSWWEFAREIFRQSGVDCRVMAATTEMVPRPAPRPSSSPLDTVRDDTVHLPPWEQGLHEYLVERFAGAAHAEAVGSRADRHTAIDQAPQPTNEEQAQA